MVTVFYRFRKSSNDASRELAPRTRAMLLRFPGLRGGFPWTRSTGVVLDENGEQLAPPARAAGRRLGWAALAGLGVAAAVTLAIRARRRPRGIAGLVRRVSSWAS
jgi:hypothetical protein